jgi:AraC-like DNA-binding protein
MPSIPYVLCEHLPNQPFSKRLVQGFEVAWTKAVPGISICRQSKVDRIVLSNGDCKAALLTLCRHDSEVLVRGLDIPVLNYSNNRGPSTLALNVFSDDAENGRCAAEYLLGKGFKRFLFVGHGTFRFSRERREGFCAGLDAAGHACECVELESRPISNPLAFQMDEEAQIASHFPQVPLPMGICCENDGVAHLVLAFLRRQMPEQYSLTGVVGIDDEEDEGKTGPGLTSVRPDFHAVGRRCAEELARALQTGEWERGRVVRVPGARIVERASTGGIASDDALVVRLSRRIHQLVEAGESPRVDALAAEFRASSRTLLYHFQAACGQSLREYILELRLQRAARLCSDPDRSLSDIAYACGFDKQGALSTHFRKRFEQSPAAYRKSLRPIEVSP